MSRYILFFALLAISFSFEVRQQFGVTFGKNTDLPKTVQEAEASKWIKLSDDCSGVRYVSPQRDISNIVFYDKSGKLAGIEVGLFNAPSEPMRSRYYEEKTFEGRKYYALTAYFVDPNTICGTRTAGPFGDRVWWKSKEGFFKLPLTIEEVQADPKWKLGTCILGMGLHYWYDISNGMKCEDFTPFFVMYNNKQLTTFAVGLGSDQLINTPNSRFEHPPKMVIRMNFRSETLPACLMEESTKVSTMHFFFTSMLSNRCQGNDKKLPMHEM